MIIVKASEVVVDEDIHYQQSEEEWKASFYYIPTNTNSNEESLDKKDGLPTFNELKVALNKYRDMTDDILYQLSRSHEVASRTEHILYPNHDTYSPMLLSSKLEHKIKRSAETLEQNMIVLERLLKPFPINIGILPNHKPDADDSTNPFTFPPKNYISNNNQCKTSREASATTSIARYIAPYKEMNDVNQRINDKYNGEEEPYDTASHILTHMTREWTDSGASIRRDTHDWIVDELLTYHNQLDSSTDSQESPLSPVLVPGAGLGRLAFDIAFTQSNRDTDVKRQVFYPFVVEAVDNSLVMGAAAYQIFHYHHSEHDEENLTMYPMASDPFINEVDSERRWKSSVFPEDKVSDQFNLLKSMKQSSDAFHQPNISYVIGDFVSIYASPKHGAYSSVATCFFIDTATNIYEYILTIRNLLKSGGLWINLGPVQWHRNAQLQPTTAELKDLILLAGFEIMKWEISDKLIAYRHPDDIRVGTRAEAYRPLKFVVQLQPDPDECSTQDGNTSLLSSLEKVRQVTGRKSMMIPKEDIDDDTSNANSDDDDIDA